MDRSRVAILMIFLLLPLGGLQARLVQLQIVNAPDPQELKRTPSKSLQIVSPRRGSILDAKRRPLAEDRRAFDLYLVLEEYEKTRWNVAPLAAMTPEEFDHAYEEIFARIEKQVRRRPADEQARLYRRERRTPYLLARDIPPEGAFAMETSPERYPGAVVRESLKRVYPGYLDRKELPAGGQVLGYLQHITADRDQFREMLQDGRLYEGFQELVGPEGISQLYHRGAFHEEKVGAAGIEKRYDDDLRGRPGLAVFEREPGTSSKRLIELRPAQPGKDIELTIDMEFQKSVESALAACPRHAGAVVLDIRTGAVLALASGSGYDPNLFTPPITLRKREAIEALCADREGRPLKSWAFAQSFNLGSIFKIVTAVAGLEEKKVRADEALPCNGKFFPTSDRFQCHIWREHHGTHGELVLYQALERSCNCYFYELGRRVEMEGVLKWAKAMGCASTTGLDLPGEAPGNLPKRQQDDRDVLSLAIGQHQLLVTPIQAAVLMASIANGGYRVTPHVRRGDAAPPVPLGISNETIREVQRGLYSVVHEVHGTAYNSGLRAFRAAGKTSSAQTHGPDSHAWFAGYAPYDDPQYAISVFVEFGGHGGEAAAPVAAKILELLFPRKK